MSLKKFHYSEVDKVVSEIEEEIKKAKNTISSCNEIMGQIGKKEDVWTGDSANRTAQDWKKSKEEFQSFVEEFRNLINNKYTEAGQAHRKFENN